MGPMTPILQNPLLSFMLNIQRAQRIFAVFLKDKKLQDRLLFGAEKSFQERIWHPGSTGPLLWLFTAVF